MKNYLIETQHLYKRFGNVTALDDINIQIQEGEFVAIMGASGSGKTTLMNILTGLDIATEGKVMLDGIDAAKQKPMWGVEIKWSDRYAKHPGELGSLLWYMPKNGLKEAIVTSETVTTDKMMDSVVLHFLPAACYAYTVGENTLKQTQELNGF